MINYVGSVSGQSLVINLYCNKAESLEWDGTYSVHTDGSNTYYQMTMNTESGCPVLDTASYWFFLKDLRYIFAAIGVIGGLVTCMAGRLLLT